LVRNLSRPSAEPSTPLPVADPVEVERALDLAVLAVAAVQRVERAHEAFVAPTAAARPGRTVRVDACARAGLQARRPEVSDTSRSADSPPNSTATLPNVSDRSIAHPFCCVFCTIFARHAADRTRAHRDHHVAVARDLGQRPARRRPSRRTPGRPSLPCAARATARRRRPSRSAPRPPHRLPSAPARRPSTAR
jgi:hypothetical protein